MSAIFPTSGPWQTKHDFDVEGRTTIIGNVDGEIIDGTTHHSYDFVCRTLDEGDDSQSLSIAVANAEFIVRAANAHEAMKAALVQYISDLRYPPTGDSVQRRIEQAERALALAERRS